MSEYSQGGKNLPAKPTNSIVGPAKRSDAIMNAVEEVHTEDLSDLAISMIRTLLEEMSPGAGQVEVQKKRLGYATVIIDINADATFYGLILGSKQSHLQAFNTICKIFSDRSHTHLKLQLKEVQGGVRRRLQQEPLKTEWDRARFEGLMQAVFQQLLGRCKVVTNDDTENHWTAVEVLCSADVNPATADWVAEKFDAVVKHIGLNYGRRMGLTIVRDHSLFLQATLGDREELTNTVAEEEVKDAPPGFSKEWDSKEWNPHRPLSS